ncbi:hypothetical protein F4553_000485 [Allocatelliglobosispora scoriae]|uniref:Lipoprotein LpqB beta-propeller domain-containing protein n=1 Tax=Allocatelliglobosispora scoriae TaxID=643052 RepID=A0A841BIT2_9ACTN|nr:hypothetical protein [Allocatelliglobosispora scoriae]MBB5867106.1 hypothetical protein [Allocatelliglobosispora scoriae]
MSDTLRTALRRTGDAAPVPRVADDTWTRGRRRRTLGRAGQAAAVLLAVAVLAVVPSLLDSGSRPHQAGDTDRPGSLGTAYPWQARHHERPNGPAAAVFSVRDGSGETSAVVGRDGSYRLLDTPPGHSIGIVSPDGRLLAGPGRVVDLTDGTPHEIRSGGIPMAWSPDGRKLLLALFRSRDPDADPFLTDQFTLYDIETRKEAVLLNGDSRTNTVVAFSPDGTRIAISVAQDSLAPRVVVLDTATTATIGTIPLAAHQRLAGTAAWTPDGRSVALVADEKCASGPCITRQETYDGWHLQFADPVTGAVADEKATGRSGRAQGIAGWRGPVPVVVDGNPLDVDPFNPSLVLALPDGTQQTLLTTPDGTRQLTVPRDLIENGTFADYRASPWDAQPWFYRSLGAGVLIAAALTALGLWLRRRRSAAGR